jgi:MFS family permease
MQTGSQERRVLVVTSAAHYMTHLYELAFPAIALTVRDDLGWSLAEVLQLSFVMYLLFGLGALPAGMLADRTGAKRVLSLCMLGAGVGSILVAFANGKPAFVASLALVGLSISAYHPAGMSLLSRVMQRRGRALGINGVFGNLGSATAPFVGGLLAYWLGWRVAFGVLGGLGVVVGLLTLGVPLHHGRRSEHPTAHAAAAGLALRYFAILCGAMVLAGFAYRGVALLLPATFREQATFLSAGLERLRFGSLAQTGNLAATTLASFAYAVGIVGQLVGGHLADKHDLRKMYLLFWAASLPFLLGMAFTREGWLLLCASGYVFFSLGMQPVENSLVARFTPERWRSTSYGIKFILNFGVGSLAVYAVTALQRDGDFTAAYLALGGVVAAVCVFSALLLHASRGQAVRNDDLPARVQELGAVS